MTATPYDGADWPAVISAGPGYYGLRLPQEYGTIVEYVDPKYLGPRAHQPWVRPPLRKVPACDYCGDMLWPEADGVRHLRSCPSLHGDALGAER